jgi:DinB superfamily
MSHHLLPYQKVLAEHRAAVGEFADAAARLDTSAWLRPLGPGRWSPALITEHVALGIESFTDDAAGRAHMVARLNAWKRFVARTIFLKRVLKTGHFPDGLKSPREFHPSLTPHAQPDAIENLNRTVATLETTLAAHPDPSRCKVTHPYFGALPLTTALRLLALHARHHLAQLPRPRA